MSHGHGHGHGGHTAHADRLPVYHGALDATTDDRPHAVNWRRSFITDRLKLVYVEYIPDPVGVVHGEQKLKLGQLVIDRDLVAEVQSIFSQMARDLHLPFTGVVPIKYYDFDQLRARQANATYGYVNVSDEDEEPFQLHATGRAVDLRSGDAGLMLCTGEHPVVRLWESYGWRWLGHRETNPLPFHFDKAA